MWNEILNAYVAQTGSSVVIWNVTDLRLSVVDNPVEEFSLVVGMEVVPYDVRELGHNGMHLQFNFGNVTCIRNNIMMSLQSSCQGSWAGVKYLHYMLLYSPYSWFFQNEAATPLFKNNYLWHKLGRVSCTNDFMSIHNLRCSVQLNWLKLAKLDKKMFEKTHWFWRCKQFCARHSYVIYIVT